MGKALYIAEKPSVAQEFAKALKLKTSRKDGYLESDDAVITWCVGHLVTMSYPDAYDPRYKKWSMSTLPFIPQNFRYEVIDSVKKQFRIVSELLNRPDIDVIYVCTDSGREGEYIYRLTAQEAHVSGKIQKRVWIDSQTEEEILRGIREAKDLSEYDNLSASAYLRAKEDYLMGINFSRVLTLKYGDSISSFLGTRYFVISVGRVMTCVLGMVVRREREIRAFEKTPFYRVIMQTDLSGYPLEAEWKAAEPGPGLYKDIGFLERSDAQSFIGKLSVEPMTAVISEVSKKQEKKQPPLLFNLAELQNECAKRFKINPDETLRIIQELYEKKLVTYPRTDARVLSTAVAKEITRNLEGLCRYEPCAGFARDILDSGAFKGLAKTRYVNDGQITDHYAIIPTGQGLGALGSVKGVAPKVYDLIVRRFLSVFYPAAVYLKTSVTFTKQAEAFIANAKVLERPGYLEVADPQGSSGKPGGAGQQEGFEEAEQTGKHGVSEEARKEQAASDPRRMELLKSLKKGRTVCVSDFFIREGETTPPKRYNSGSLILAMENAGQLIEDEELRAMIKGSGIGTSATRAEILKKLCKISYLDLNKKTQIVTPTLNGEMVYDVVDHSIRPLLNPELTASWEKGLTGVAGGTITPEEYMEKLDGFIRRRVESLRNIDNAPGMRRFYQEAAVYYKKNTNKHSKRD